MTTHDAPELIRRVHPYLHHADQGPSDITPDIAIVFVCPGVVCGAFFSLQLCGHEIYGRLIMSESSVWVILAQLGKI